MLAIFLVLIIAGVLPCVILLAYPFYVWFRARLSFPNQSRSVVFAEPVSVLLNCYNEDQFIERKIEEILDDSNWIQGSELLIISAGSTDSTNSILKRKYSTDIRIKLFILDVDMSKIQSVNYISDQAQFPFLVFSDCRQRMEPGSIPALLSHFSNPKIGTVTSTLDDTKESNKPSFFRSVLNRIAVLESKYSSSQNVFGALYAQRKSVFRKFPEDILFDDLYVVVSTINQGFRLVQSDKARIYDISFDDYYQKNRLYRLVRGLLLFYHNQKAMIKGMPPVLRYRFLLFKYLKLILPFALVVSIIGGIGIVVLLGIENWWFYSFTIILGSVMLIPMSRKLLFTFFRINLHFVGAQFSYWFGKNKSVRWQKLDSSKS